MDKVEARRKRIINFLYLALVLGLVYLFIKYCFWVCFPFIFAFFVAIIVQKLSNFIVKKTKLGKGITSTILVLLFYILIGVIISLIGVRIVDAGKSFVAFVTDKISDFPTFIENIKAWVINTAHILPDSIEKRFVATSSEWFDTIKEKSASEVAGLIVNSASGSTQKISLSTFASPLSSVWSTAKQIPSVFVSVIITIVSSCFMAADYDTLVNFIKNQVSDKHKKNLSRSKHIVFTSIGKLIKSYVIIILITGVEIFVGLTLLTWFGLYTAGNVLAISVIVALLDILPVIGTGTFMVPWAIYSLITGHIGLGIGLFVVYAVIYVVRQIIEPKIVGGTVGLPPVVTLMGMYIGSQLFGFIGIFMLPIIIIIVKLLNDDGVLHIWKPSKESVEEIKAIEDDSEQPETKKKKKFGFDAFKKKSKKK